MRNKDWMTQRECTETNTKVGSGWKPGMKRKWRNRYTATEAKTVKTKVKTPNVRIFLPPFPATSEISNCIPGKPCLALQGPYREALMSSGKTLFLFISLACQRLNRTHETKHAWVFMGLQLLQHKHTICKHSWSQNFDWKPLHTAKY